MISLRSFDQKPIDTNWYLLSSSDGPSLNSANACVGKRGWHAAGPGVRLSPGSAGLRMALRPVIAVNRIDSVVNSMRTQNCGSKA